MKDEQRDERDGDRDGPVENGDEDHKGSFDITFRPYRANEHDPYGFKEAEMSNAPWGRKYL